jgi:hypothetical protein
MSTFFTRAPDAKDANLALHDFVPHFVSAHQKASHLARIELTEPFADARKSTKPAGTGGERLNHSHRGPSIATFSASSIGMCAVRTLVSVTRSASISFNRID